MSVHVIQRGINGSSMFGDDEDCQTFLTILESSVVNHGVSVHTYALMKTHHHLLVTPTSESALPQAMRQLGIRYVQYFNRKYSRTGPLFNERYRGLLLDNEHYWITCCRYIEQNPVRARIADAPDAYPWSSYATNGLGVPSRWLVPHPVYLRLGTTPDEQRAAYRELCAMPLTDDLLAEQRWRRSSLEG
jgi:putative transposase